VHAIQRRAAAAPKPRHRATGLERGAGAHRRFDYTTVGHVTVDVMPDGSRRPGGTAFYSALQASRLGLRTLLITRGVASEIEQLLEPYRQELELDVQPAPETTTLFTSGSGTARRQRVLAWAGPIEGEPALDTAILHLAPVARETPARWRGDVGFVGLTPQGLVRRWPAQGGEISLAPGPAAALPGRCDAIVLSEVERESCEELVSRALRGGAVVAVTAGHRPTTILIPGGRRLRTSAQSSERPGEDLGAGDVFAAAFFVALGEGRPEQDAASFAGAAAALRIAGPGTDGIGSRSAIEARARAGRGPRR
jgi:sugar/nucleoside kinase (ribokinase family)